MKQKTETPAPDEPITFSIGVMLPPAAPGEMSRLYPAGTPSPWTNVSDVPPNLREHIGTPPKPNFNVEAFRAETKMIQQGLEPESETVRAALENIDNEAYQRAKALAETVIKNETPKGTLTEQKLKNYTDVLLGKARIVRASKPLTTEERIANRLVIKNRAVRADMSQSQRRACVIRGCL